jgi:hypothetical protein
MDQKTKAELFRRLHSGPDILVVLGVGDAIRSETILARVAAERNTISDIRSYFTRTADFSID